ncbi:MAG: hypothetical protein ACJA1A_000431 [Saprospiraceae bacterium]|jgi:hypothetical protein
MFKKIISMSWKSFMRSPAFTQNLATTIMMAFLGLYFGVSFIALGAASPHAITEMMPDVDGPIYFGRYFLYFTIYTFLTRLIFQNFGFKDLKQYILQKIPKSTLLHYILTKSAFNWINVMSLLGVIAYLISASFAEGYDMNLLNHGLALVGLIYASNYKAFLFDKQLSINKVATGSIIIVVILVNYLDYKGFIPLGDILEFIYSFLVLNIGTALLPLLGAISAYFLSYKTLSQIAYLEDTKTSETSISDVNIGSGLFARFGKAGKLMEMEVKLILRNKRARNMLYIVPFMGIYPLIIHGQADQMGSMGWMMFVAIFCTGGYALTYGQLLLSWNSGHFDLLQTKMTSIKEIFQAKYFLQCILIICQTLPMLLWGFYKTEYFYLMPAMMFYNLGVVLFLYMLSASYNSKRVDTNKGAAMNYEGFSLALFLIIIPIMAIPVLIFYGANAFDHPFLGVFLIALIGLIGFVFHDKLINISVALFKKNRYKIGAAFRNK